MLGAHLCMSRMGHNDNRRYWKPVYRLSSNPEKTRPDERNSMRFLFAWNGDERLQVRRFLIQIENITPELAHTFYRFAYITSFVFLENVKVTTTLVGINPVFSLRHLHIGVTNGET